MTRTQPRSRARDRGRAHVIAVPGYSTLLSTNISNVGGMFVILGPFEERKERPELHGRADRGRIAAEVRRACRRPSIGVFGAPPVEGLGSTGGIKMQIQDKRAPGCGTLQGAVQATADEGQRQPGIAALFSTFSVTQPQIFVEIDREKAKAQSVSLDDVNNTLQSYLGSYYVNDFTFQNRNWQVNVQADPKYRMQRRGHRATGSPQRQGRPRAAGHADPREEHRRPGRSSTTTISIPPPRSPASSRRAPARGRGSTSWTASPATSCPRRWATSGPS